MKKVITGRLKLSMPTPIKCVRGQEPWSVFPAMQILEVYPTQHALDMAMALESLPRTYDESFTQLLEEHNNDSSNHHRPGR